MYENIVKKLISTGLTRKRATVYIATLQCGTAPASEIARTAKMNRITTYNTLSELLQEGLVTSSKIMEVTHFTGMDPEILINETERRAQLLSESLPLLKSLTKRKETHPTVRFFEGIEGVKNAYKESLSSRTEILNYANSKNIRDHWPLYDEEYVTQRKQKAIFLRGVYPKDKHGKRVQWEDKKYFRETRLLPKKYFEVENEIKIFDDKVLIASFEPEAFAIIIKSTAVAKTQQQIFECMWKIGKE